MGLHDDLVLMSGPAVLADVGVEVVVPPLPALLPDAARQLLRDVAPVLGPTLFDQL